MSPYVIFHLLLEYIGSVSPCEGVLFEALAYIAYIRKSYYYSLVCASKKAIKKS